MEWQPISTYDEMPPKKRPKWVAFYFEADRTSKHAHAWLQEIVCTERRYGFRVCTHWCPLPPPPKG